MSRWFLGNDVSCKMFTELVRFSIPSMSNDSQKRCSFRFTFNPTRSIIRPNDSRIRHERRGRETLLSSSKPNFERILRIGTRFWSWFDLFLFGQKGPRKWFQARVNPSRRLISPPLQDETTSLSIFSRCLTKQVRDLPFRGIRGSRGSNIEIFWPTYVLI